MDAGKRTVEYLILKDNSGYGFRAIATLAGKMVFIDQTGSDALLKAMTPAPAAEEEPAPVAPSALEEESKAYLLGKVVKNDVTSGDGTFSLTAGTVLTEEILGQVAKYNDVLLTLTMDV